MLQDAVAESVRRHRLFEPGEAVLVAVSGGADSVALLGALRALAGPWHLRLVVAHLNHGLRAEAGEDARFVTALAGAWSLPVVLEVADVRAVARAQHLSVEAAAREVRYAFLARAAAREHCPTVAVAHTADDQAETFVLRLLRGGRPGGMWPRRSLDGMTLVRPLLDVWRRDLRAWLQAQGLPWRDDPTNLDMLLLRNRVRHDLIPLLAGYIRDVQKRLKHGADLLAAEDALLEDLAASAEGTVLRAAPGGVRLARGALRDQPQPLRWRLVRRAVARAGGNIRRLRVVHIEETLRLAEGGPEGRRVSLPGVTVEVRGEHLLIAATPPAGSPPGEYAVPLEGRVEAAALGVVVESGIVPVEAADVKDGAAYLDADRIRPPLLLRAWRPGDRFRPLGMRGLKKVGDFLTDARAPHLLRPRVPVLQAGDGTILWLVGWRVAEDARVTPQTRRVLRLRLEAAGRSADSAAGTERV